MQHCCLNAVCNLTVTRVKGYLNKLSFDERIQFLLILAEKKNPLYQQHFTTMVSPFSTTLC